MNLFITFALAGAVTALLRMSMSLFGQRLLNNPRFEASVSLVSPGVLAAIVTSAVFLRAGQISTPDLVTVAAITAAFFAVRKTENIGVALVVGLPIYWLGAFVGLT